MHEWHAMWFLTTVCIDPPAPESEDKSVSEQRTKTKTSDTFHAFVDIFFFATYLRIAA